MRYGDPGWDDLEQWGPDSDHTQYATESEAHVEWHRNSGVPMGQPGCPQDACDPDPEAWRDEDPDPDDVPQAA